MKPAAHADAPQRVIVGEAITSQLAGGARTSLLPGEPESGPRGVDPPEATP